MTRAGVSRIAQSTPRHDKTRARGRWDGGGRNLRESRGRTRRDAAGDVGADGHMHDVARQGHVRAERVAFRVAVVCGGKGGRRAPRSRADQGSGMARRRDCAGRRCRMCGGQKRRSWEIRGKTWGETAVSKKPQTSQKRDADGTKRHGKGREFERRTSSQSDSGNCTAGDLRCMPAQLTRMSISPPIASSALANMPLTASRSARSASTVLTVRPRAAITFAVSSLDEPGRRTRQMLAPASARAMAQAAPIPVADGEMSDGSSMERGLLVNAWTYRGWRL